MQGSQINSRNGNAGARARSASRARPWYKRALCGLLLRRQPAAADASPPERVRATASGRRPLWLSSPKAAAAAVARVVCLREPLCSTNVHVDAVAPRRVVARTPVGRSPRETLPAGEWGEAPWSTFRGRTVKEDLLMRRFVMEEEATRWRMVKQVAANRYGRMWVPPLGSRLSMMSLADDDDNAEEGAGESGSSSLRCSGDQPL